MEGINFGGLVWFGLVIGAVLAIAVYKLLAFLIEHVRLGWS